MHFKSSAIKQAVFELKSLLGRLFMSTRPRLRKGRNYLNLGCGSHPVSGCVNADFFSYRFFSEKRASMQWQLDLRYPLNCSNEVFDGIFTEHTLEHLYPDDAERLLKELYRILKPGCVLRITVPDLGKYVRFYNGQLDRPEAQEFHAAFSNGCQAIRNLTQNYFHFCTWDFAELKAALERAGFRDVKEQSFKKGELPELLLDLPERAWETLYVEAKK